MILYWCSYKFRSNSKAKFDTVGTRRTAWDDVEPESVMMLYCKQKLKGNLQVCSLGLFERMEVEKMKTKKT